MSFYWAVDGVLKLRSPLPDEPPPTNPPPGKNPYEQRKGRGHKERKPAITANQIMSAPVQCLAPSASFDDARDLIRRSRFRHVPIVNSEGKLSGIISDRDVLREAAEAAGKVQGWVQELVTKTKTVGEFMTTRILTASVDAEIRQIAKVLFEERIGSMPIVDEAAKPVGIITRSDILRTLITHTPLELWI